jgi:3-methyladenine DNA glycosylase AlkD
VNNWDLVDSSAGYIAGHFLLDKNKQLLYTYAHSKNLWERRIAIIATQYFISQKKFDDTLEIAEILLHDSEDLIHKAVGWMLREIGKINQDVEEEFLKKNYKIMPRTMLRYAIEKFDAKKKMYYMKKD